jgi:hypothetical protein
MHEVTKDGFYDKIGPLNVQVRVLDPHTFPYTTIFETKYGRNEVGRSVDSYTDGKQYPLITKYYISDKN